MRIAAWIVCGGLTGAAHAAAPPPTTLSDERCEALAASGIEGGSIDSARVVPQRPANAEHPDLPVAPIPAYCRVALTLRPTKDSDIKVEVWLPVTGWNGRFLGVGAGGYAGIINEPEMATAVQRGYAAATTDTGHGAIGTEAWALGHPEKIIDFGHRAVHLATRAGKTITARYYETPARFAYFASCSNGGRQALMEASRYPDDYDGIIAGAPAADFTGLVVASFGSNDAVLRRWPIAASKLPALQAAVLAQCDALDGAADGLVNAAQACHFDPSKMQCGSKPGEDCLSADEISALQAIYRGPQSAAGREIYPGFSVGGEAPDLPSPGWLGWLVPIPGKPTEQYNFYSRFMRDFVTEDPQWDPKGFLVERDIETARRKLSPHVDATSPDLSAFAAKGGKLILWHGWSDQAIPAQATLRYYENVKKTMGEPAAQGFSRLYMVPGMQHCFLGPGPWAFNPAAAKPGADPQHDMAAAMERWVEKGVAPDAIVAIRPKNAFSVLAGFPPLEVDRTGLLCPYPQVAKFDGKGSSRDASSYRCALPP